MERKKRTSSELIAASDHLQYEYWMFIGLSNAMSTGIFGKERLSNAVVESFTIHTRILLDFLYSEKPWDDDVIAEDFITEVEWHRIRPPKSELLKGIDTRVGKEIAHLTYSRQHKKEEGKSWPFLQIVKEVDDVFQIFLENVDKSLLGERWKI